MNAQIIMWEEGYNNQCYYNTLKGTIIHLVYSKLLKENCMLNWGIWSFLLTKKSELDFSLLMDWSMFQDSKCSPDADLNLKKLCLISSFNTETQASGKTVCAIPQFRLKITHTILRLSMQFLLIL